MQRGIVAFVKIEELSLLYLNKQKSLRVVQ